MNREYLVPDTPPRDGEHLETRDVAVYADRYTDRATFIVARDRYKKEVAAAPTSSGGPCWFCSRRLYGWRGAVAIVDGNRVLAHRTCLVDALLDHDFFGRVRIATEEEERAFLAAVRRTVSESVTENVP